MDADGANLKPLTEGEDDLSPVCAFAGKWVYYFSSGKEVPWMRVAVEGGAPEQLDLKSLPAGAKFPVTGVTADDRTAASFNTVADPATNNYRKEIIVFHPDTLGSPPLVLEADPRVKMAGGMSPQFTPDGQAMLYAISGENNVDNLFLQPLNGKTGRQITQFSSEQIFGFRYSPSGKRLGVARGHTESDVIMLRDTAK